jgi:copper chaperone CopZ
MDKVTLRVEGMSCGHCEIAVNEAVRKLPGIKKVKANRRKNEVSAVYDAELTGPEAIAGVIAETGYTVAQ